jgi:signal transduction histidine kinase
LTLTLSSALSAVLAKGWVAKYLPASAASAGKNSSDACERHLRAIRASYWHLDGVISAIPLLLQLSLLLFLAGLVISILGDSKSIGHVVLALVALVLVLYIVVTFLPWLSPACPFRTTLSTFVPGMDKRATYRQNGGSSYKLLCSSATFFLMYDSPAKGTVELMILAWILANSARNDAKAEAFKAIAGLDGDRSWDLLLVMQEYNAIRSLCMQLKAASDSLSGCEDELQGRQAIMQEASKRK